MYLKLIKQILKHLPQNPKSKGYVSWQWEANVTSGIKRFDFNY